MVYAQLRICPREWNAQTSLEFWDTNGSPNISQKTRPSDSQQKKRTWIVDFAIPVNHRVKLKESKKQDKYLDLNCNWCPQYNHHRISTGTGGLGNKRMSRDHPNYGIVKIGQNTEKSPGDLRRLAVIQTPMTDHQLTLEWKTLKREK